MNFKTLIKEQLEESIKVKRDFSDQLVRQMEKSALLIIDCYRKGKKVLLCGNGGSAADAQHIAAELVNKFRLDRKALAAVALTTDSSIITAWSNDYDFNIVFSRQVEALGKPGDVFFAISTSGNSKNIIEGMKKAKKLGLATICLLGKGGGKAKDLGDVSMVVPSDDTARIQEAHITIGHIICDLIEKSLFSNEEK